MSAENDSPAQTLAAVDTLAPLEQDLPDPPAEIGETAGPTERGIPAMSVADCQRELAQRFPALFGLDSGPQPIKLRIHVDIQAQAPGVFTRRSLAHFLSRHTTSTAYLKALVKAPHRLDLTGAPAGEIATEHRQAAQVELERRKALVAERRRGLGREDSRHRQQPRHQPAPHKRPPHQPRAQPPQKTSQQRQAPQAQGSAEILRAFESSPLSKANFCALKGLRESELDEVLALAAKERRA